MQGNCGESCLSFGGLLDGGEEGAEIKNDKARQHPLLI